MYKQSTLNFENIYQDMFNNIKKYGQWSSDKVRTKYIDGTPAKRKQIIGYQFRFDNSTDVIPLIKSRFIPVKSCISELYWIWIMQSNKVQDLRDLGCKFWDEWEMGDGTIGKAYGYQIGKETFGQKSQLHYIINEIKNNPDSSRILTELWNVDEAKYMALTPCIHLTQWSVINGELILEVRSRSQDLALGCVANVYQYSILHRLVALECGLKCGDMIYSIHNLHYYDRHEEGLTKQFEDYNKTWSPNILPKVKINNFTNIFDFKPSDIEVFDRDMNNVKINYEIAI